jgi:hypothetical protein
MPAVELSRLQHQIDIVTEVFGDPARLRSRCLDLLEFYASRVRPGSSGGRTGTVRSLGVPPAVMRALEQGLRARAEADSYAGAMAAEVLWATPVMESRWLAVSLLERQPLTSLPDWIAAWSQTAEDPQLLERMAGGPMRRLWRDAPDLFWGTAAANLAAEGGPTTVALLALEQIVPDLEPDDLPRVFAVLDAAPVPQAGEAWRAYLQVVRVAARRSPPETARFLVDEIEHARPGATRVTRQTLSDFPPRQRDALRQALRLSDTAQPTPHRTRGGE